MATIRGFTELSVIANGAIEMSELRQPFSFWDRQTSKNTRLAMTFLSAWFKKLVRIKSRQGETMNPDNTGFFHILWLKLIRIFDQLDQSIERFVQDTIDDLEKTYQQD